MIYNANRILGLLLASLATLLILTFSAVATMAGLDLWLHLGWGFSSGELVAALFGIIFSAGLLAIIRLVEHILSRLFSESRQAMKVMKEHNTD